MSSLVGRPDESMNIELASSSIDSEDEEDDNMLDDVEAGVAEAAQQPPKPTKARNVYSIAHEDIVGKRIVYIHIDVEHGGPDCGMVQISVIFMDADFNIIGEFDEFIRPPDTAVWDEHATRVHGYHRSHESIVSAKSIVEVWAQFKSLGCIFLFQECPFLGLCFSFLPGFLRIPWDSCFFRRNFFTGTSF